jgi:hypothetical protein
MVAAVVLVPVAIIGVIAWIAVAVRKSRTEGVSPAALTSLYASLLMIFSATVALLGAAVAVKVILGFINESWSYGSPFGFLGSGGGQSCSSNGGNVTCQPIAVPSVDVSPQRTGDIALAVALIVVGAGMFAAHRTLHRRSALQPGGTAAWVEHGTRISFAFLYAPTAIFAFVAVVYGVTAFLVGGQSPGSIGITGFSGGPFGDGVGAAAAFIPAWVVAFIGVRRGLAGRPLPPPRVDGAA